MWWKEEQTSTCLWWWLVVRAGGSGGSMLVCSYHTTPASQHRTVKVPTSSFTPFKSLCSSYSYITRLIIPIAFCRTCDKMSLGRDLLAVTLAHRFLGLALNIPTRPGCRSSLIHSNSTLLMVQVQKSPKSVALSFWRPRVVSLPKYDTISS